MFPGTEASSAVLEQQFDEHVLSVATRVSLAAAAAALLLLHGEWEEDGAVHASRTASRSGRRETAAQASGAERFFACSRPTPDAMQDFTARLGASGAGAGHSSCRVGCARALRRPSARSVKERLAVNN